MKPEETRQVVQVLAGAIKELGEVGGANAGLYAVALLAIHDAALADKLEKFRNEQKASVLAMSLPPQGEKNQGDA